MFAVLLLALAATPTPLASAREHLAAGKLDEVLFDLDGKTLNDADKPAAAELLAKAGDAALGKEDAVMSLQFAQMALRLKSDEILALEVGARASRAQQQYGPAEEYADKWIAATQSARAHLLRAELATDQGDWQQGLDQAKGIRERDLSDAERGRLKLVRETCQKEIHERKAGSTEAKALEAKLEAAAEKAKRMPDRPGGRSSAMATESSAGAAVILYGTKGSAPTRRARDYLRSHKVAFVEKDLSDPAIAQELAPKMAAQHVTNLTLPIIDCRGTLVVGFNRAELDRLIQGL